MTEAKNVTSQLRGCKEGGLLPDADLADDETMRDVLEEERLNTNLNTAARALVNRVLRKKGRPLIPFFRSGREGD